MKKHEIKKIAFLITFLLVGMYTHSQVLWYGDPDNNVTSSFRRFDSGNAGDDCSNQSNNSSTATTTFDSEYGKVWEVRKPKGQKRGEFARTTGTINNYVPKDGDVLYYGWRWKINSTPNITSGIAVWQWKTDAGNQNNTQNYPLNMGYENGNISLNAWGPCYPSWNSCSGSISKRKTTLWNQSIPENTWVSFVIKIKLSRNEDVGYIEFWYNGEKQTLINSEFQEYKVTLSSDGKRAYHKTFDGTVVYPKWGSYNANACNFDVSTYYDEMRIATTLAAATPSGTSSDPNKPPTVALTNPSQNNQTFTLGETITLRADAADPDGDVDRVNFKINGSYYKLDKTSPYSVTWTPTEAGTYTIGARAFEEGQEGLSTEVIRTIIVTTDTNNNTSCSYGTPIASGIGAMDKISYSNTYVVGNGGPNLSNIKEFSINWNPQYNGLYQFAFNTKNGTPDWYIDYKNSMSYQLKNAKPEVTLSNTGIANLDGSYWVTKNGNDFIMVSKTKGFSIYFSNSSSTPACNKAFDNSKSLENIMLYPNPVHTNHLTIQGVNIKNTIIEIVDIQGKVITTIHPETTTTLIDVSNLETGLYIASIKASDSKKSILFAKK
ncbi:hypothetical protein GCM10022393_14930 [Aquimarina addita]|uniref:Secretion system C-terminal sorting domain-containing protein n=1 Tax=Aquimarina addita TaxID=870485 RepID=A0ABP7XFU9_9FLAO